MKSIFIILFFCFSIIASAQKVAIKTNVLSWATTTLNIGGEFALSSRITLDLPFMYNPFRFRENKKIMHWLIQPEGRYWLYRRFMGHFLGVHVHYGKYNGGIRKYRYDGWLVGGGIAYGYQWIIGKRWNVGAELGIGYAYLDFDKYLRKDCGRFISPGHRNYVGPTKAGVNFIYFLSPKSNR